jgi:hypothetical protein
LHGPGGYALLHLTRLEADHPRQEQRTPVDT